VEEEVRMRDFEGSLERSAVGDIAHDRLAFFGVSLG
jgi:hypothetical protein